MTFCNLSINLNPESFLGLQAPAHSPAHPLHGLGVHGFHNELQAKSGPSQGNQADQQAAAPSPHRSGTETRAACSPNRFIFPSRPMAKLHFPPHCL